MATKPITCPGEGLEGFLFFHDNLVLDSGNNSFPPIYMFLNDIGIDVESYSKNRVILPADQCFLLSQNDIGDYYGYVSFIAVKAVFPANTVQSKKYLEWTYKGQTYYMGELMILSGSRKYTTDSTFEGWNLAKPSEVYTDGGILFCNPHTDIDIKIEILVAR